MGHVVSARNASFAQIVKILGADALQVLAPADITVSSGTNVNGWNDSTGNGNNLGSAAGSPQKITASGGHAAVRFNGTTQSLTGPAYTVLLAGGATKHWGLQVVKQVGIAGNIDTAGTAYTNRGSSGDSAQYVNWAQWCSVSGGTVDKFGSAIWINGSTEKWASCTTNPTGSNVRSLMIVESWIDAGNVLHVRCQDGSGTATGTTTGVTGYGLKTGLEYVGAGGGGLFQCDLAYQHFCNVAPDPLKQAYVRKNLGRLFGMPW